MLSEVIKHRFLYILLGVFAWMLSIFSACHTKTSEQFPIPTELIHKDTLVEILTELSIMEAGYNFTHGQISLYGDNLLQDADSLFSVFKTDRKHYENTMEYYTHHNEQITEIYKQVTTKLQQRLQQLQQKKHESE